MIRPVLQRCAICHRPSAILTLGCCQECLLDEFERIELENCHGCRGGQGRDAEATSSVGEFLGWAVFAAAFTVFAWFVLSRVK